MGGSEVAGRLDGWTAGLSGGAPRTGTDPEELFPAVEPSSRPAVFFTYSHSPSRPPSLPNPDSLYPPNPLAASNMLVQLTQTVPALSCGAISSAVFRFSLHTLAARP